MLGAAGYISSEEIFSFLMIKIQDPPTLCSKYQEARGLHSVSALFQKVHTTQRSQEALHGFTQESTWTKLVPTQQDLKKTRRDFQSSTMKCSGACRCGTHEVPRKEGRRSSLTRIPPM
jgi:hypothetical protein